MVPEFDRQTQREYCRKSLMLKVRSESWFHTEESKSKQHQQIASKTNAMIEKSESQDMWGYDLPLTPPLSPTSTSYSMIDMRVESVDLCSRLQPICQGPDEILEEILLPTYRKTDSIVIKDCMWGALEVTHTKRREHSYTRLYLGEPPSGKQLSLEAIDGSSKFLSSVDPTEVFPSVTCLDERMALKEYQSSDSEEESDADVDVVTVEPKIDDKIYEMFPTSPEIISPPKTPDSEPAECVKSFVQTAEIECTEVPRTKQMIATVSFTENTSKRSREVASLHERFSRASHNVLERKRRNELKGKFYDLRDSIPELSGNKKVPKVVILKKAIDYIDSVKVEESTLKSEIQRQKKLQQDLRRRLAAILHGNNSS